jgi:hypothetical protein
MNNEARTVSAMIQIYCRAQHGTGKDLCGECTGLFAYARKRIERCPFGYEKPVCNQCNVHCYNRDARTSIQTVMRFAGPRMIWHHPVLAIRHLIRSRKKSA